jgi:hypothetical protein
MPYNQFSYRGIGKDINQREKQGSMPKRNSQAGKFKRLPCHLYDRGFLYG